MKQGQTIEELQAKDEGVVVIFSGGMDSTALLYKCREEFAHVRAVSFDYGQRHRKELLFAARSCAALEIPHAVIDLSSIAPFLPGNALTGDVEVPHGHYAAPTMKRTVVPNRNAIMLSVACGIAAANGAETAAMGVHAGDHPIYPDCREEFIRAFEEMERLSLDGISAMRVYTPFIQSSKADIARIGEELGVPWRQTWSCYEGGDIHCGRCGTCVERREAFQLAGIVDPTDYV